MLSGEIAVLSGEIAVMPGEIAVMPGEIPVLSEEIALKLGEIGGVLGRRLVKPQAVSENSVLLLQHPELSGLVLAVTELLGGPVD